MAKKPVARANPATGLVPVRMLASEAGFGLRKGEIRGVDPEVAARMINLGSAVFDDECEAGVTAAERAANKRGDALDVATTDPAA